MPSAGAIIRRGEQTLWRKEDVQNALGDGLTLEQLNLEPGDEIVGRLFTTDGDTLSYVSESDGDELTIWFGEKGSPAFYKGEWKDGGNTLEGEWTMPGDGGYKETMTRVE